jgi:hypothetical protein
VNKLNFFTNLSPEIRKLFLISLLIHIITSWFSGGWYQFDEHFQILEYLHFKMGLKDSDILPWEFKHKMRPGFQIYLYWGVTKFLNLFTIESPFFISFILRLLSTLVGWFTLCKITELSFKWFQDKSAQIYIATLSSLLWFFPFIHSRTSSENLSGSLFFLGLYFLLKDIKPEIKSPIRQNLPDNYALVSDMGSIHCQAFYEINFTHYNWWPDRASCWFHDRHLGLRRSCVHSMALFLPKSSRRKF